MLKLNGIILEIFHYFEHNALPEHSKDLNVELKTIGNNHFALGVKDINEAKEFVEKIIFIMVKLQLSKVD